MDYKKVQEIARFLGKEEESFKIAKLYEVIHKKRMYVTFWGHYSAGKSRLINNLLDMDLLPVQSRETTAVLTYIQYGEEDRCRVAYYGGDSEDCDISTIKEIYQNNEKRVKLEKIEYIEIYINNSVLKEGLVIVDTPGINTVIQKHQDLAIDALEQSGKMVYVLGGAPNKVDREFIKKILECGIEIIFVRTKCDQFNEMEENIWDALNQERDIIKDISGEEIKFIPLSNVKNSVWNEKIRLLKNELNDIAEHLDSEIENAGQKRLIVYYKEYLEEMNKEKLRLSSMYEGDFEKTEKEIMDCESNIELLKALMDRREEEIREKISLEKTKTETEVAEAVENQKDKFACAAKNILEISSAETELGKLFEENLEAAVTKIQRILNERLNKVVEEEQKILCDHAEVVKENYEIPTYTEITQENDRILKLYRKRLQDIQSGLEEMGSDKEQIIKRRKEVMADYDEETYERALAEIHQALAEIPNEPALRVVDEVNIQPSKVFKQIGQAIDIALLLLPGDVIVGAIDKGMNIINLPDLLKKAKQIGNEISKTGKVFKDNANIIDTVRDRTYVINEILKKRPYARKKDKEKAQAIVDNLSKKAVDAHETFIKNKKSGNILDALSVAYWTERFGAQFDKPPRVEIDVIEEERKQMKRKELYAVQEQIQRNREEKMRALGVIEEKEKTLDIQRKEQEELRKKVEDELEKQEIEIKKQARVEALEKYKADYCRSFEKCLERVSDQIIKQCFNVADNNIVMYISRENSDLIKTIENRKQHLEQLIEICDNGKSEIRKNWNYVWDMPMI